MSDTLLKFSERYSLFESDGSYKLVGATEHVISKENSDYLAKLSESAFNTACLMDFGVPARGVKVVEGHFDDEDEDDAEPWFCPVCDGDVVPMGHLGRTIWGRCRQCGVETSKKGGLHEEGHTSPRAKHPVFTPSINHGDEKTKDKKKKDSKEKPLQEGTGNFYNKNASAIFVFGHGEDADEARFDYKDTIDNVQSELGSLGYNKRDKWADRDSKLIAEKTGSHECKDGSSVDVTIKVLARSGYYEAANLDWEIEEEGDDTEECNKAAEAIKDRLVDEVEGVFKKYTTPYGVSARFSSGETWYKKLGEGTLPDSMKLSPEEQSELDSIRSAARERHERARKAAKARGRHDFPESPYESSWAFEQEFRRNKRKGVKESDMSSQVEKILGEAKKKAPKKA